MDEQTRDVAAHFSAEEIKTLDRMQGGADIEKYGAPYYGKLWGIIESKPEIKTKMSEAIAELFSMPPQEARKVASDMKQVVNQKFQIEKEPVPEPQNDIALKLASEGEEGDTEIAFMPAPMLQFFWDLYPEEIPMEERINDNTGLPQFFIFDLILPVLGGIVGTIIAPGIGTAIGAGLGSVGGDIIHNLTSPEDEQRSFLSMLGKGLLAGGLGYAGGAGVEAFQGGAGLMDAAKAGFGALTEPLVGGTVALGGLMNSYGGTPSQDSKKKMGGINDYNKEMQEARARDRARIDTNYAEAMKYRDAENKRAEEYEKIQEAERQEKIRKEQAYQRERQKAIGDYNARYFPSLSPEFLRNLIKTQGV